MGLCVDGALQCPGGDNQNQWMGCGHCRYCGASYKIVRSKTKKVRLQALFYSGAYLVLVTCLATLNPLSQYVYNYRQYGTPVVIPVDKKPRPSFFEETYLPYSGITSISDGFFTFKLNDLIEHPITDLEPKVERSTSRTSLWTYLYGSGNSVHFENYPPSWRTQSKVALLANRAIFVLALLPVSFILAGFVLETGFAAKALFSRNQEALQDISFGLFVLLFAGYILFIALYAYHYRIYIFFKAIFVFPALLSFAVFFQKGHYRMTSFLKTKDWLIDFAVVVLVLFYAVDVASLISDLGPNGSGLDVLWEFFSNRLYRK